jgi:hypothetical protein
MIQALNKSAQALLAVSEKNKKIFYSLPHNDLSTFQPSSKSRFFDKIAQVRAIGWGDLYEVFSLACPSKSLAGEMFSPRIYPGVRTLNNEQ